MSTGIVLRAASLAAAIASLAPCAACADIYTWIDASGMVNVSNLAPPSGVRVTNVTHPPAKTQNGGAAREAELQAMKERIRNLEAEIDLATRPPAGPPIDYRSAPIDYRPAPVEYRPMPVPIVVPYPTETMSWAPPYAAPIAPQPPADCPWNCGLAWGSPIYPIYPPSVVVVRVPGARGGHPGHRGHNAFGMQPWRVSDAPRRR